MPTNRRAARRSNKKLNNNKERSLQDTPRTMIFALHTPAAAPGTADPLSASRDSAVMLKPTRFRPKLETSSKPRILARAKKSSTSSSWRFSKRNTRGANSFDILSPLLPPKKRCVQHEITLNPVSIDSKLTPTAAGEHDSSNVCGVVTFDTQESRDCISNNFDSENKDGVSAETALKCLGEMRGAISHQELCNGMAAAHTLESMHGDDKHVSKTKRGGISSVTNFNFPNLYTPRLSEEYCQKGGPPSKTDVATHESSPGIYYDPSHKKAVDAIDTNCICKTSSSLSLPELQGQINRSNKCAESELPKEPHKLGLKGTNRRLPDAIDSSCTPSTFLKPQIRVIDEHDNALSADATAHLHPPVIKNGAPEEAATVDGSQDRVLEWNGCFASNNLYSDLCPQDVVFPEQGIGAVCKKPSDVDSQARVVGENKFFASNDLHSDAFPRDVVLTEIRIGATAGGHGCELSANEALHTATIVEAVQTKPAAMDSQVRLKPDSNISVANYTSLISSFRTPIEKASKGHRQFPGKKKCNRWTISEDELLKYAVSQNVGPTHHWSTLSQEYFYNSRNANQCKARWRKINPSIKRVPFSADENETILHHRSRGLDWSEIAALLTHRTAEQVRYHFVNKIDPRHLKKAPWTAEEETLLVFLQRRLGNRWVEISEHLPGRSDLDIKNHWHNTRAKTLKKLLK